jgi:hypothetical protein
MDALSANFNLHATLEAIGQGIVAVVCHMLFDWALHGLILAGIVALIGFALQRRYPNFGRPLLRVSKRTSIFCAVVCVPGCLWFVAYGRLPDAGVFNFNSLGLIGLWSLIYVHLSAEEINHQRFYGRQ